MISTKEVPPHYSNAHCQNLNRIAQRSVFFELRSMRWKKEVFTCGRAVMWVVCLSISPLLGIARQRKHTGQVAVGRRAGRQAHLLLRLLLRHHRRPGLGGRTTDATMAT